MKRCRRIVFSLFMCLLLVSVGVGGKTLEDGPLYPAKIKTDRGDYYGYIDATGKWIVEPTYDMALSFTDGYGVVSSKGLYGVVNEKGKEVIPLSYEGISPYKEKRAVFNNEQGSGVIDTKGNIVTKKYYSWIQDYADGLAIVGKQVGESTLYGYINREGEEVIPPKYMSADDFKDGKALVKVAENRYEIINKKGEALGVFNYPYMYGYNEGLMVYSEEENGKLGYIDDMGKVVIAPKYEIAEPFKDGVAVVGMLSNASGEEGLIDKEGNEIYPLIYNNIRNLGEGRVALGKAIAPQEPFRGSMYAIADHTGRALTDFIFYGVSDYQDGLASVYDAENTYFIDKGGQWYKNLPRVSGSGTLTLAGKIVRGDIDYVTLYQGKDGNIIYIPSNIIPLTETTRVKAESYKPNLNYIVYYPQIAGLTNKGVEGQINEKLKIQSMHEDVTAQEALEYTYYSYFTVPFYKDNLLILNNLSSTYYFGAAHPMPNRIVNTIDLETGQTYALEDLFKPNSNWRERLNSILAEMAKKEPIASALYNDQEKVVLEDQQGFYVDGDSLYIYYPPYDIGPYSSGYIEFKIPYTEIEDIINKEGNFWKSFHQG